MGIDGNPITPNEIKSIQAAARASRATGAAMTFHRAGVGREKLQVLGIIGEEGGDLTRTILGHSDMIAGDLLLMKELLELGRSSSSIFWAAWMFHYRFHQTRERPLHPRKVWPLLRWYPRA